MQLAVSVSVVPLAGVVDDGAIVQIGNALAVDQVTARVTGAPVPCALVPATE